MRSMRPSSRCWCPQPRGDCRIRYGPVSDLRIRRPRHWRDGRASVKSALPGNGGDLRSGGLVRASDVGRLRRRPSGRDSDDGPRLSWQRSRPEVGYAAPSALMRLKPQCPRVSSESPNQASPASRRLSETASTLPSNLPDCRSMCHGTASEFHLGSRLSTQVAWRWQRSPHPLGTTLVGRGRMT